MAEVTVEQLAKTVGTDPDKLLSQMKDAGLPHKKADEGVSDDDKRTLLAHLKRSHGSEEAAPRKITLKRKSVSTLKTGGSSGKRTVNVEVRKKRTYVKRPEVEESAETEVPEVVPAAETLSERDLRVVRLRYGLDDGTVRSTRECAALLGIGKESVRQICLRAFRTLRGTAHGAALLDYMD